MYQDDFLDKKINERISNNALRELKVSSNLIDFCSNDYLGIVKNNLLVFYENSLAKGSTGSRLLAGNFKLVEEVEHKIASFHAAPAAIIFNSGYDANIGLLSSVPQRGDTVLYDYLCHASIRDGIRLSVANSYSFAHNDLEDLQKKMLIAQGNIFIVTESVFSMDGDIAPLQELILVASKFNAHIIVDEAHATGTLGCKGEGLVQHLNLQDKIFARIHTFGKACGCHGAAVVGSKRLKNYLINFARSFIYTTSLSPSAIAAIEASYEVFPKLVAERNHLQVLIDLFKKTSIPFKKINSNTPIQAVIVSGNNEVINIATMLQNKGFDVRPILYPTVPKDSERLRIVLHSFNTIQEVEQLLNLLNNC